jgi:hypothetical protein
MVSGPEWLIHRPSLWSNGTLDLFHIACWEDALTTIDSALPPISVGLLDNFDDISFLNSEISWILGVHVKESMFETVTFETIPRPYTPRGHVLEALSKRERTVEQ